MILMNVIQDIVGFKITVMNWTVIYRSKQGNKWTIQSIKVMADSEQDAIRKADKWPGIIIKVKKDEEV